MKILIADDDNAIASFLEIILSEYGECAIAKNGEEAVALFLLAHEKSEPFDVIFLDIAMPKMDGQEALKSIRQKEEELGIYPQREAVIIMATAMTTLEDRSEAFSKGRCTDYLIKPLSEEMITDKLTEYFDLENGTRENTIRKKYDHILFSSKTEISLSKGTKIQGTTVDVSFNSILFVPNDKIQIEPGTIALVKIGLDDNSDIDEVFAAFSCWVVRSDEEGIVFKTALLPAQLERNTEESSSPVVVKRSNGRFEDGWEIFYQHQPLPKELSKQIRHLVYSKSSGGPVVVCVNRAKDGNVRYKILNLQYLKELQESAEFKKVWFPESSRG